MAASQRHEGLSTKLVKFVEPGLRIILNRLQENPPTCATDPDAVTGKAELARQSDGLTAAIAEEFGESRRRHDRTYLAMIYTANIYHVIGSGAVSPQSSVRSATKLVDARVRGAIACLSS